MKRAPILTLALLGPSLLGAWLAFRVEPFGLAQAALGLPLVLLGVAALTAPALYIGSAVMRAAPPPAIVLRGLARALDDAGLVTLGLLPAVLFLGATAEGETLPLVAAGLALFGAVLFGLRLLFVRVFESVTQRIKVLPVFGAWAVVSLGIGTMLLARVLDLGIR